MSLTTLPCAPSGAQHLAPITVAASSMAAGSASGPMTHGARAILVTPMLWSWTAASSLDAKPSVQDAAAQLAAMGVTRIAVAPCVIGPEADPAAIEEAAMAIGAKCCAPLGAHGNVVKLISLAYGQVLRWFSTWP